MQKRIADYGYRIGRLPTGARNKITDVAGVRVGHSTIRDEMHRTGCTVILPSTENIFTHKFVAASFVHNGFGKTVGTVQIDELGTLETPIALTNTLNVGLVSDALVEYTIERCSDEGVEVRSVNPVVGECNDAAMSRITDRPVKAHHVFAAIESASVDFAEGDVGAGTGTRCYGFKGGIGSASRVIELDGNPYTVGVLVQSNYGATRDLRLNGSALDKTILDGLDEAECDRGSIIVVLACDLPLTARQLRRVIRRCSVGIARLGSYIGHGSGEVFIGFSTANVIAPTNELMQIACISESSIDKVFRAAGEATEEAILNSMVCAAPGRTLSGRAVHSLAQYLDAAEVRKEKEESHV
ncbi:MAG: P1 family peptidase [Clostridia bacterium]|nr:P1 family peptidase [Clostridia bacterium]